jgi:glutaredoxin-related protein
MKGSQTDPECGLSRATLRALGPQDIDLEKFALYDVLEDEELRSGSYSPIDSISQ